MKEIEIPEKVSTVGAYAFSRCTGLESVSFAGDAPAIGTAAFNSVKANVYYPADNVTWTADVQQNYGGQLIWNQK